MKDWYLRQSSRDRMIVIAVGLLCLIGGLYSFVWYPMTEGLAQRRLNIENQKETLAFMQEGAVKLKNNQGAGGVTKQSKKAPYLLIDELIKKAGLKLPKSIQPTKTNGARVDFSEVEFDKLIGVLAELELYGLQVESLNVTKERSSGMVSARFNVEKG